MIVQADEDWEHAYAFYVRRADMELQDDCLTPTVLVGIVEDPPLCLLNLCHLIMNAQPLSCAHHSISSPFRWSFILLLCARVVLSCTHCTRVRTHTYPLPPPLSLLYARSNGVCSGGEMLACICARLLCCVLRWFWMGTDRGRVASVTVLRLLLCWRVSVLATRHVWHMEPQEEEEDTCVQSHTSCHTAPQDGR